MNMEDTIILSAVADLKVFGYPEVNQTNILEDNIYRKFFQYQLDSLANDPTPSIKQAVKSIREKMA